MVHTGACLCGQSKVTVHTNEVAQVLCHCTDCQRTSGSSNSSNILPLQTDVKIEGPHVKEFQSPGGSGNPVTRIFCGNCGSALAHKSAVFGPAICVQTGNIPDFAKIPVGAEIWTKSKWSILPPVPGAGQFETNPPPPSA